MLYPYRYKCQRFSEMRESTPRCALHAPRQRSRPTAGWEAAALASLNHAASLLGAPDEECSLRAPLEDLRDERVGAAHAALQLGELLLHLGLAAALDERRTRRGSHAPRLHRALRRGRLGGVRHVGREK